MLSNVLASSSNSVNSKEHDIRVRILKQSTAFESSQFASYEFAASTNFSLFSKILDSSATTRKLPNAKMIVNDNPAELNSQQLYQPSRTPL